MSIKNKKNIWYFLLGLAVVPIVHASTPATVEYFEGKIAILQAQINQINSGR